MKTGRHEAWREYGSGALWVLPGASMVAALVLGALLSTVRLSTDTPLRHLLFQGTEDDARTLLIGVVGAVITIIALVLCLTLVALIFFLDHLAHSIQIDRLMAGIQRHHRSHQPGAADLGQVRAQAAPLLTDGGT